MDIPKGSPARRTSVLACDSRSRNRSSALQLRADWRSFGRSFQVAPGQAAVLIHVHVGGMVAAPLKRERIHKLRDIGRASSSSV